MTPIREREDVVRNAISEMDSATLRGVVKSAIKEMIEEQVQEFGWYTVKALGVAIVGGVVLFVLWANGWHRG